MRSSIRRFLALLAVTVVATGVSLAAVPEVRDKTGDFLVTKWTTENGLPQNTVTSIVQTSDGYIWLGTFGGLARFDGIKFTVFDSVSAPSLASNRILSLYEDSRKRLWIGTETGEVYTYKDGGFVELESSPNFKRRTVWGVLESRDGALYVSSSAGLERFEMATDGSVRADSVRIITREDTYKLSSEVDGTIWTTIRGDAYVVDGDRLVPAKERGIYLPQSILELEFAQSGNLFVGASDTFGTVESGRFTEILKLNPERHLNAYSTAMKSDSVWLQPADDLTKSGTAT